MTTVESDEEDPVRWGQVRMNYLEQHLQKLLDDIRRLERENEQLKLELENEKSAYKRLEQENEQLELENLQNLKVAKTDEEIHERRRRERMLDEITLICVRDRIEQLIDADGKQTEPGATTEQRWGRNSRDTADNICRGINEYDAAH
jgi:TolA-binding protein